MYIEHKEDNGNYIVNFYDKKDDYFFGFVEIIDNEDCYVISGQVNHFERDAEVDLFESRKHKLHIAFIILQSTIKRGIINTKGKPVLILDDELISRDAIKRMNLKRVPRYCGYYFI